VLPEKANNCYHNLIKHQRALQKVTGNRSPTYFKIGSQLGSTQIKVR
jgi:hypothetical protein